MPLSRRSFLRRAARLAGSLPLAGCGLLLHPERNGRPHSGRLDPSIVILDAVGCIFFIVPGLLAFIVDFATGTIYLPPDCYGQSDGSADGKRLTAVHVTPNELTRSRIESEIERETGHVVRLDGPDVRLRRIERVEDYPTAAAELAAGDGYSPTQLALD